MKKLVLDFSPFAKTPLLRQLKIQGYIPRNEDSAHKLQILQELTGALTYLLSMNYISESELRQIELKIYEDIKNNLIYKVEE
jgi:hypothetical protein